ncbi:MAG: class I SAM-dependent methyltransferase, partial [Chitinophagaceae bacterium]
KLKNTIREFVYSLNRRYTFTYRLLRPLWKAFRLFREPRRRGEFLGQPLLKRKHQFQDSTFTLHYRYPRLFEQCRLYFQHHPAPRILSFGCSTGEEVFSLIEYMPQAIIAGIDINRWCIRECNLKNTNEHISFDLRHSGLFDELTGLDAIFCMAVFQRAANRDKKVVRTTKITFQRFERELKILDKKLRVGGLFFIDVCDFDLADTLLYTNYRPLEFDANRIENDLPVFGRDNEKIANTRYFHRVFVKLR